MVPTHLDMLIFKLTDQNADVTYTLWRFDVQGWLDQYPSWWVHSLNRGPNLMVAEFLEQMDHVFGDVHEYDMMIHSPIPN